MRSLITKFAIVVCMIMILCIWVPSSLADNGGGVDVVLQPDQSVVPVNGTFDIDIVAKCDTQQINGVGAFLDFDPEYLEVQTVMDGMILDVPLPGGYDNDAGTIDYSAGTFENPPPEGDIIIATIRFRAKAETLSTNIEFHTDAPRETDVVLGGTSVLNSTAGATVTIAQPSIISCDPTGLELNAFAPGMSVYVKGTGLAEGAYQVWITDDPVDEGDALSQSVGSIQQVDVDSSGSFGPLGLWTIPADASPDHNEYDIVLDRMGVGEGRYSTIDGDEIDSIQEVGFVAPTPELSSIVLMIIGLAGIAGCFGLGVARKRNQSQIVS
ncbi:MAG: cohesin domain-containing protein [Chloroflexota bacterium]|nr:cohesin domain-containing protein [Chloroflexota bacterium]